MNKIIRKATIACAVTYIAALTTISPAWCQNVPPIASYQTDDPELRAYLILYSSLEKDLQGVIGKEYDAKEQKAYLDTFEKNARKDFDKMSRERQRGQEGAIEAEKKQFPLNPLHHLALIPEGADAKDSIARTFIRYAFPYETVDSKESKIVIVYFFKTARSMSEKARALREKLRPALTAQGLSVGDTDGLMQHSRKYIEDAKAKQGAFARYSEGERQLFIEHWERSLKDDEAGGAYFKYEWPTDFSIPSGGASYPLMNRVWVVIHPNAEPVEGRYMMSVGLSRDISQLNSVSGTTNSSSRNEDEQFAGDKSTLQKILTSTRDSASQNEDVQSAGGDPSEQKILTAAGEIRKLIGNSGWHGTRDEKDAKAKSQFESALSVWRNKNKEYYFEGRDRGWVRLFQSYFSYLIEAKKPSAAIDMLRTAILEADKVHSYRWGIVFRLQLADTLASIGQIEVAQGVLAEAQATSDREYGTLSAGMQKAETFPFIANAAIITASIRNGSKVDKYKLSAFASQYEKALDSDPVARFFTPFSYDSQLVNASDESHYRHDQEYWRWIAVGALRVGDADLARRAVDQMLRSAIVASNYNEMNEIFGVRAKPHIDGHYAWPDKSYIDEHCEHFAEWYMRSFYAFPEELQLLKMNEAFSLETMFDSALAGAEIYLQLDDSGLGEELLKQATSTLPYIRDFSDELRDQGHTGLNVEQRTNELNRVTAKLHIKNKRWREALVLLDKYIAWSESYRNSLSLEERLPYFRSQSQGVYLDAILARASLFASDPQESNFLLALDALGKLKARHLMESLDAGGKTNITQGRIQTKTLLESVIKSGKSFLSIADAGEDLVVFFADSNGKDIRITRKPTDLDKKILDVRNALAERQVFDSKNARGITSLVLGELEPRVFEQQRLVVEIDGSLSFLPVELWLNSKMTPLGENTAVSYIPTLAMAGMTRTPRAAKGILAVGDAQFDQKKQISAIDADNVLALRGKRDASGFLPLPETRDEINSIVVNLHEGGKTLLGEHATKSEFFQAAHTPYRYLHFATHGVVGGEIPSLNEPALVVTPEANDPGFLTASEIGGMDISADLVVLSACNSGNGEYYNGEGLMGLGRAFIVAGAKAVVVSLWPVDSNTTKELMVKFYRELEATGDATLALATARNAVMKGDIRGGDELRSLKRKVDKSVVSNFNGRKNPFFWGPFILVEAGQ